MSLTRTRLKMPEDIRAALAERRLMDAYQARPEYQQNDYLGWITRAKRETTRAKRLEHMLYELEHGDVYMNMKWQPKPETRSRGRHLKNSKADREAR
jgi:uncharacterized protein YdeI (YjbR/CyaY-like superfamily)